MLSQVDEGDSVENVPEVRSPLMVVWNVQNRGMGMACFMVAVHSGVMT